MLNLIRSFWTGSIQRQLMVGIILVHAVLMSIFVYDLVNRQADFLHKQSVSQAQSLSQTLSANSVSWILSDDVIGLEEVLHSQKHYPDLRYAMVLSPSGRVLGHTDTNIVGLYVSDDVISLLKASAKKHLTIFDSSKLIDVVSPIFSNGDLIGWARVGLGQEKITSGLKNILRNGIFYTLLAIIIGALFAFFMAKSITKDLKHLVSVADGVKQGHSQMRSNLTRKDEIGQLSNDFNLMLDTINKSEELQKNYQITLEHQVSERTAELEKKADELVRATQLKSEFLANMSHELRTPMNSIIGFTARVIKKSGDLLEQRQLENLHTVERNAHHLLGLINGLLDLSKIEAGKMEAYAERFSFNVLANDVVNLTQPMLKSKQVVFKTDLPSEDIELCTDNIKLKQVLINLVSNAIKFTDKGSITIAASIDKENADGEPQIIIQIIDTGAGMDKEALEYIFEAFRQVDGTLTRKAGGTGLGLAIVRSFIELLHGTVTVASEEGVGTTFEIIIPVNLDNANKVLESTVTEEKESSSNKLTVLCIDDESDALDLLSGYLRDEDYHVITALNGEDGIRLAKQHHPFAITLDILMPHIDGWSVLSALKSSDETHNIPVIIISFLDNTALGYQLGAYDYMQKPIEPQRLTSSIHHLTKESVNNVLVVDDDAEARDLMCQILEDAAIHCSTAMDGNDALIYLKRTNKQLPELILLDLMMPNMDGFELLKEMQKTPAWAAIPVIVVTAKTLEEHEREFLRTRVESILAKDGLTSEKVLQQLGTAIKNFKNNALIGEVP